MARRRRGRRDGNDAICSKAMVLSWSVWMGLHKLTGGANPGSFGHCLAAPSPLCSPCCRSPSCGHLEPSTLVENTSPCAEEWVTAGEVEVNT